MKIKTSDDGCRPAEPFGRCYHCGTRAGDGHNEAICPVPKHTVVVRLSVDMVVKLPRFHKGRSEVERFLNGTPARLTRQLEQELDAGAGLEGRTKVTYLGEATEEDHKKLLPPGVCPQPE